jgi:hypothetical protein
MGLLAGYRRYWCLLWLALLAAPLAVQLAEPAATASEEEARILSTAPAWPHTARGWLDLPRALDRFLGDHFGLRTEMVRSHARLRYAADLPSDLRVTIGRDNWLFLNGDGTIEQATGSARDLPLTAHCSWSPSLRTVRPLTAHVCRPGRQNRPPSPNTM